MFYIRKHFSLFGAENPLAMKSKTKAFFSRSCCSLQILHDSSQVKLLPHFFNILHFLPSWTCWESLKGTWGVLLVPENSADCRVEKAGVCFYSVPKITAYRMIDFSELFVPLAHCSSLHSMSLLAALEGAITGRKATELIPSTCLIASL